MNAREKLSQLQTALAAQGVTDIKFLYAEGSATELADNMEEFLSDAAGCLAGFMDSSYTEVIFEGDIYEPV